MSPQTVMNDASANPLAAPGGAQIDAKPNSTLSTIVPIAPVSIALRPPMRSVKKPLTICPTAYAISDAEMIQPICVLLSPYSLPMLLVGDREVVAAEVVRRVHQPDRAPVQPAAGAKARGVCGGRLIR